jgi:hypothetical protein
VVAANNKTTADISASLGMNPEDQIYGIVIQVNNYNGWYDNAWWEKLSLWISSSDG